MHRPRANPFMSGLISGIVLLVVMCGVFISGVPAGPQIPLPWSHQMMLHVQLANADALAPHASVEIAGVKIGEVYSVDPQGNIAIANLQIGQQYSDIHRDATVYLRAHGLFGPKYIAIVSGTAGTPALHDGDTISVNQTVQPVDLDSILQALQAPEQQNLRTTIVELGQAAASRGSDVNHLLAAADSLTQVLQTPLKALDNVSPQLSNFIVNNEAFNNYFAQTPLDQLVANSEQTIRAFAANAGHLESVLIHADSTLTQLDTALNGQPGNLANIIQTLGKQGAPVDQLKQFTYLLGLFGANLTGKEKTLGTPAAQDVTGGIIGAISNVASAFYYSDPCGATPAPPAPLAPVITQATGPAGNNHCNVSPDGRQHFLHVRSFNVVPTLPGLPSLPPICLPVLNLQIPIPLNLLPQLQQLLQQPICLPSLISSHATPGSAQYAGDQMGSFGSLFAS